MDKKLFEAVNNLNKVVTGNDVMSKRGLEAYEKAQEFVNLFQQTGQRMHLGHALLVLTKFLNSSEGKKEYSFTIHGYKTSIKNAINNNRTQNKEEEILLFEFLVLNFRKIIDESPDYADINGVQVFATIDRYYLINFLLYLSNYKRDKTLVNEALSIVEILCSKEPDNNSFLDLRDTILLMLAKYNIEK